MAKQLSYGDYLKLDELLDCQEPESVKRGRPCLNRCNNRLLSTFQLG